MSNKVFIDPGKIDQVKTTIRGLANEYESTYQALYNDIKKMQGWTGADSTAYIDQTSGLEDNLKEAKTIMDEYATFLETAAQKFREVQQSIIDDAKKLSN